ncbi:MAG TPA: GSCFA domain-containing protein [Flavobacterium sp.]|nr:GSCFA domain-containing protein [Flavobacterium sp.]
MSFFLPINIPKISVPIDYNAQIVSIGSCFAENIANKLSYFQFRNICNPWGILFHPLAIEKLFDSAVNNRDFSEKDIFCHQEVWSSFDVHSALNALSKQDLLEKLQKQISQTAHSLKGATHIIITLGTAWAYWHKSSEKYVANCHKTPQKEFEKRLLPIGQIVQSLDNMVSLVRKINPDCQFIFTISPVRHIKDGMVENQQSKAHLIAALHEFLHRQNTDSLYYFPSYEIMMDELRDYRFYAQDMLHPNETAIAYIWQKFVEACIGKSVWNDMGKVDEIRKSLNHKPFNAHTLAHQKFVENLKQKITFCQKKYPFMDFENM